MRSVRADAQRDDPASQEDEHRVAPGKVTLTSQLRRGPSPDDIADRVVQRLARGSGAPLDAGLRDRFEGSLGADLGGVRVHTDGAAADAAKDTGARAFALGQDVYFGAGQYRPESPDGQLLIAHEVAHTVQQQGAAPAPQFALETAPAGDACEDEADSLAAAMVAGAPAGPVTRAPVQRIARSATTTTRPPARDDLILEQIAHRLAYQPRLSDQDVADLRGWGYEVATHQTGLRGSLDFLGVRPIMSRPGLFPVMAFRGTLEGPDFIDDANPEGIGMYQFTANEAVIRTALGELGGEITVTGHSLGGALAQICAAMYPAMVGRVVTFQAPGIRPDLIERMRSSREGREIESHHHRVDGDFVEHAGAEHTPGRVSVRHEAAIQQGEGRAPLLPLHQSFPLAEQAEDAGALPPGVRFSESGERRSFEATTFEATTDDIVTDLETPRRMAGGLVAAEEARYVRAWMRIRGEAEAGTTRWSILQARIDHAEVSDANKAALRDNLSQLFPELAAAGELEAGVLDGSGHVSRVGFVRDVERRCGGLSALQRARVERYYDHAIAAAMRADEEIAGRMSATGGASGHHRPMRKARGAGGLPGDAHAIAARGAAGAGEALPHGEAIQAAFGRHDVGGVAAHLGGEASAASEALGARAYAYGDDVVFDGAPDLHTAAHEAAHVVQQRAGVHLAGGVGAEGDAHERHADAVADRVVRGESAEDLLDAYAPAGGAPAIQRLPEPADAPGLPGLAGARQLAAPPVTLDFWWGQIELSFTIQSRVEALTDEHERVEVRDRGERGVQVAGSSERRIFELLGLDCEQLHDRIGFSVERGRMQGQIGVATSTHHLGPVDFSFQFDLIEVDARIGAPPVVRFATLGANASGTLVEDGPLSGGWRLSARLRPNFAALAESALAHVVETGTAGGTATGSAALETGVGGAGAAVELAATIAAPLAAGAAMAAIFAHDVGETEDLGARARGHAHALYNYCMAYTMYWLFDDPIITGTGVTQGAAAAREDVAAWRADHPGATRTTDTPEAIYSRVFDVMRIVAATSLRRSVDAASGSFHDEVIRDAIDSVRWGGRMFLAYGHAPVR